jgi:hypothetical protein
VPAKNLAILLFLVQAIFSCSTSACEQFKLSASDANADDRFGVSVAIDGDIAVVGAYQNDSNGSDSGAAYVFELSGTDWIEQKKLIPSDGAAGDKFARSVAIEGSTIVVGSHLDDNSGLDSGSAYVFSCSGGVWSQQQKLTALDGAVGDRFGFSVSIDTNTIVVGAYGDDAETGAAYVFTKIGPTWTQQQKLTASDPCLGDRFGWPVAIDNNTIIVGAYQDDHSECFDAGSAYVFTFDGLSWTQEAVLRAFDPCPSDHFGFSVALDGNSAVIGAYECDVNGVPDAGAAYVFDRTGAGWVERQKLFNSYNPNIGDDFGRAVAVEGDTILVGCPNYFLDDEPTGAVFEFVRSDNLWIQRNLFTADDANTGDSLGFSAAISDRRLITGAHYSGDNGSAYVFTHLPGDLDRDCAVDFIDFAIFALCWRTAQGQTGYDPACDISIPPDMLINILDLNTLCDDWLTGK